MNSKPWRWVAISGLAGGLVAGLLGLTFILYVIIAAEGRVDDFCEMTEIGEGLLPYGDEGGCDPNWAMWRIAFLYFGGMGALPVAGAGIILVLALMLWRRIVPEAKG